MSSTQRSESMNSYFDGYINSKTTLKQFVEQYENALAKKVEIEKYEDAKSLHHYIPCITEDELEKQFQSVYTNAKFKEFQKLFVGRLKCEVMSESKVDDVLSKYEVEEDLTFGEEKRRRRVSFIIDFNGETNEANSRRHDNMCNLFNVVADLAEDSEEKYEKVMGREVKENVNRNVFGTQESVVNGNQRKRSTTITFVSSLDDDCG
ncbi:protein FAR1-RELATED SEQUENCE 5-like [Actinidia eriantha]|uniref:protein FAR1-RELATED SEQUENCE 5-like n=1 Tax=Actinidia eriantha TaxID=165200 RepID=UPI002587D507|nr:protein FAR1-RELATED SEQUENCE 5-like [Actinidia eriantha]